MDLHQATANYDCDDFISDGRPNERLEIIGGKNVTIEEYPYQVSIQSNDEHVCGGSIINTKYILTAAHCVYTSFKDGTIGKVTGWGLLGEGKPMSDQLQEVDLPIITRESCLAYQWLPDNVICAGYKQGGKGACSADSGPLVVNGTVVGIVSFGMGCGIPKYPGVYTDVARYRSFIDPIVKKQH
nr:unnamed protein product [Callosobruchus chinensis]